MTTPNSIDGKSVSGRPKLRPALLNALLVVASLSIGLLLIEGACRFYVYSVLAGGPLPRWEFRATKPLAYQDADYFFPEFLRESQYVFSAYWESGKDYVSLKDFAGSYLNVTNGRRTTTDQPPMPARRIVLFGGSTVFSAEVPDWYTIPSYLQRLLNSTCQESVAAYNYGAPSMNTRQQTSRLKDIEISAGDVVIFLDGVNDIYYSIFFGTEAWLGGNFRPIQAIPAWRRKLYEVFYPWREMSGIAWMLADLYDRGVPRTVTDEAVIKRNLHTSQIEFRAALIEAMQLTASKRAAFIHFLQPHLFETPLSTQYRRDLASNYLQTPPGLEDAFRIGYPGLRDAMMEAQQVGVTSIDLSAILGADAVPSEVFLDFAHANHAANEILARAIFAGIRTHVGGCGG